MNFENDGFGGAGGDGAGTGVFGAGPPPVPAAAPAPALADFNSQEIVGGSKTFWIPIAMLQKRHS